MEMRQIERIMRHPVFSDFLSRIKKAETDRRFCKHDLPHLLDVGRIMYILNLELNTGIGKEIIYAAALMHDLGRAVQYQDGTDHHKAGAKIAMRLLPECGFSDEEAGLIANAITQHAEAASHEDGLPALLFRADKLSRCCFDCPAQADCYWTEESKNKRILY